MKALLFLLAVASTLFAEPLSDRAMERLDERAAWATRFYASASPEQRKEYDKIIAEADAARHEWNTAKGQKLAQEIKLATGADIELEKDPKRLSQQVRTMEKFIADKKAAAQWERLEKARQLQLQQEIVDALNRIAR